MNTYTFLLFVDEVDYAFLFIKTKEKIDTIKRLVRKAFKKALNSGEEKFFEVFESTIKNNEKILEFNIGYDILHYINVTEKVMKW